MAKYLTIPQGGQFGGFTPYGNLTSLRYTLATNAAGVLKDSTAGVALAINDVIQCDYPLPAGLLVEDLQFIVSDPFDDNVIADIGFAYTDGVNDATYPQSTTQFGTGIPLSNEVRLRTTSSEVLFALPKDAYLTVTIRGAAVTQAGKLQIVVHGERLGAV